MKILSLSDQIVPFIYSPLARQKFNSVDLIIGCGDLPYYYLEYVYNSLDVPLYFVRGNHDSVIEYSQEGHQRAAPHGAIDLHQRVINHNGLLLAGIEGSLRYRIGPFQYSQSTMWGHVFSLIPGLLSNRMLHGRYLDVFVSHAPPAGIHDKADLPHRGIRAFRWLIKVFKPKYYFHGHIHVYHPDEEKITQVGETHVVNSYNYFEVDLNI